MNFCGRCETTHFLSLERFHGILAILICLSGWTGSRWPMARTTQLTHTGSPPSDEPPLSCRKILGSQNYIALKMGRGRRGGHSPLKQGSGLTESFSMCCTIAVSQRRE